MPNKGTPAIDRERLLGSWRLESCTQDDGRGGVIHIFSPDPRGRIMYDRSGVMAAFLMNPAFLTEPDTPNAFFSYSGRYELKGDVVEHAVDFALDPGFIGRVMRRRARLEGDALILETLADVGGEEPETRQRLVWRRET